MQDLLLHYPPSTPVALVYRSTWEDRREHRSTLEKLLAEVQAEDWKLTTMLIVGAVLDSEIEVTSSLYSKHYSHKFRKARSKLDQAVQGQAMQNQAKQEGQ